MLSSDEPLLAQAGKWKRRTTTGRSATRGGALMWQAHKPQSRRKSSTLDRDKRILIADGKVVTNLWEGPKQAPRKIR
jgi:hypothetical protein